MMTAEEKASDSKEHTAETPDPAAKQTELSAEQQSVLQQVSDSSSATVQQVNTEVMQRFCFYTCKKLRHTIGHGHYATGFSCKYIVLYTSVVSLQM